MAAPKAPSELGQSWPELITAAVLLVVPPPQDGVAFGTLYQSRGYISVNLYRPLARPSIWIDHLLSLCTRNFLPSGSSQPPGVVCYSSSLYLPSFSTSCRFLLPLCPFFERFYNVESNCFPLPGDPWSLRNPGGNDVGIKSPRFLSDAFDVPSN